MQHTVQECKTNLVVFLKTTLVFLKTTLVL